jgi:hypothetical protein
MARYTPAYSAFAHRLEEVLILRRAAARSERLDAVGLRKEINALCRSAVVLLSAHLEAYVRELGEAALDALVARRVERSSLVPRFYYHVSQDLLTEIRNTAEPEKVGDKVFAFLDRDLSLWSKKGPFTSAIPIERFSKGFSNPAFKKVKSYLNRFGYTSYRGDLEMELKGSFGPTVNMVDHLVDVRNQIAHGNPSATKTPAEVGDMVKIIRLFCITTDGLFARWWGATFCSIR